MHDSVMVHMAAPPDKVWELVSDVTRIGEFSPETFEGEWLGGATGPAKGARFRGHVRRNGKKFLVYWTTCTVTECEPGRVFEFGVNGEGDKAINTWRYELESAGDGTDVTESFRLADKAPVRLYWKLAGKLRGRTNNNGMRTTLERMRTVVENEA